MSWSLISHPTILSFSALTLLFGLYSRKNCSRNDLLCVTGWDVKPHLLTLSQTTAVILSATNFFTAGSITPHFMSCLVPLCCTFLRQIVCRRKLEHSDLIKFGSCSWLDYYCPGNVVGRVVAALVLEDNSVMLMKYWTVWWLMSIINHIWGRVSTFYDYSVEVSLQIVSRHFIFAPYPSRSLVTASEGWNLLMLSYLISVPLVSEWNIYQYLFFISCVKLLQFRIF